jgi:hypothetical protein
MYLRVEFGLCDKIFSLDIEGEDAMRSWRNLIDLSRICFPNEASPSQ